MAGKRDEEVWRLPETVKGEDVRLGGGRSTAPALSRAAKDRLARIVGNSPEVMVKVTGRSRGAGGFAAHLRYITRNARLDGETHDGTPVQDRDDLDRLHRDWVLANAAMALGRTDAGAAQTVGVILSMPAAAPRDRVHEAARAWAQHTFGEHHDWLLVPHDDKDHPHVHITVRAVGPDGKRLAPGPADLQQWRERFAHELRRHGVDAEATPRQARGVVKRSERTPVHRLEERGIEPMVRRLQRADAARAAQSQEAPAGWQRSIQERQDSIRQAYLAHAAELDRGDAADMQLASNLRRFVANMPAPLTQRQALAVKLSRAPVEQNRPTPAPDSTLDAGGYPPQPARAHPVAMELADPLLKCRRR